MEWLAQDKVDNGISWSGYELLQRYVLRVLYHSTNGDNWDGINDVSTTWFRASSVCQWPDVDRSNLYCFGNGQQVDHIDLVAFQNVQGTIPEEIGLLTALTMLLLTDKQLTGTIPSQLGQLTLLELLWLDRNQLTGTIPSQLGLLTALTYLELDVNRLTGTMPAQLGQLTALTWLDFGSNQLTRTIPTQLGQLTALSYFALYDNRLTGTIPLDLTQLTNLQYLYFYNNNLHGQVPSGFCAAPFPDWRADGTYGNRMWADCISDVQCDCCDNCY